MVALAPQSTSTTATNYQGLRLVNGCNTSVNDEGLLQVTNNSNGSSSPPVGVVVQGGFGRGVIATVTSGGLPQVTITNPISVNDGGTSINNYCNGRALSRYESCEVRASSASGSTGNSGVITFIAGNTQPVGIATHVVAKASSFSYTTGTGDTISTFVADNDCNLVEEVTSNNVTTNASWTNTANGCDGSSVNTSTDWRLPDTGPTPGLPINGPSLSGEFNALYNGGTPYGNISTSAIVYYWGPALNVVDSTPLNINLNLGAWRAYFPENFQGGVQKGNRSQLGRCVRAFTTDANGN